MKLAIVFCMLLSAAFARPRHPLLAFVGEGEIRDWKVVGGRDVEPGEFPYQGALLTSAGALRCGCWIINKRTIGTAAHCIDGVTAAGLKVRVGSHLNNDGGQLMDVEKVTKHPSYNANTINNDVGVIILAREINIGPEYFTQAVILPAQGTEPADGSDCTATGWGRTSTNGPIPVHMQTVALTINGRTQCQSVWGSGVTITAGMICAGGSHVGQGICNGDSGGALVSHNPDGTATILGTMSFRTSLGCAYGNHPEVYAKIENYLDFFNGETYPD